jgi:hypothetical protein
MKKLATQKREERVYVRLSSEEKILLGETSKKEGFENISSWLRNLINTKRAKSSYTFSESYRLYKEKNHHLARIGNNLNQVAVAANKAVKAGKLGEKMGKQIAEELMYTNILLSRYLHED